MRYTHSTYGTKAQGNHPSLLTVLATATCHFPKVIAEKQSRLLFSICRWRTFHINGHTAAFVGSGEAVIVFLPCDCI